MEVIGEAGEECDGHGEFTAFETVPEAVGRGSREGGVHPPGGDGVGKFVVENGLEGRKDLC